MFRLLLQNSTIEDEIEILGNPIKIEIGKKKDKNISSPYDDFQAICEICGCYIDVDETAIWDDFGLCARHLDCSKRKYYF